MYVSTAPRRASGLQAFLCRTGRACSSCGLRQYCPHRRGLGQDILPPDISADIPASTVDLTSVIGSGAISVPFPSLTPVLTAPIQTNLPSIQAAQQAQPPVLSPTAGSLSPASSSAGGLTTFLKTLPGLVSSGTQIAAAAKGTPATGLVYNPATGTYVPSTGIISSSLVPAPAASWFTQASLISGLPNWGVLAGASVLAIVVARAMSRKKK